VAGFFFLYFFSALQIYVTHKFFFRFQSCGYCQAQENLTIFHFRIVKINHAHLLVSVDYKIIQCRLYHDQYKYYVHIFIKLLVKLIPETDLTWLYVTLHIQRTFPFGSVVVKALCCKPEGRGFKSR
jgi:hypothetical protein